MSLSVIIWHWSKQFCDRVLVMKDGRVVEDGIPDEVIQNPKEGYTKMLVDSVF